MTNEFEVLKKFLECDIDSTKQVFEYFRDEDCVYVEKPDKGSFLYKRGSLENKVLLVAHADTVWDKYYIKKSHKQKVKFNDGIFLGTNQDVGIGADDRAGVAMLYLLKDSGHSVLLLDGEEHGSLGAKNLINNYPELLEEINSHDYMIELDRRNSRDYKCYSIPVTNEFREYIEKNTGYVDAGLGSSTDIVHLCKKICGANLSVGYYLEHSGVEYLYYDEWLNTYNTVKKLLSQESKRFVLKK